MISVHNNGQWQPTTETRNAIECWLTEIQVQGGGERVIDNCMRQMQAQMIRGHMARMGKEDRERAMRTLSWINGGGGRADHVFAR